MLFAMPSVRSRLALSSRPAYDPDVKAKRLVQGDKFLDRVLYGSVDTMAKHYARRKAQEIKANPKPDVKVKTPPAQENKVKRVLKENTQHIIKSETSKKVTAPQKNTTEKKTVEVVNGEFKKKAKLVKTTQTAEPKSTEVEVGELKKKAKLIKK
jgi:hypothetical protein